MKTAISIPDGIFREAERTARRLKMTRSELYRRALEAFMVSLNDRAITESYDEAFADAPAPAEVRLRRRAARSVLEQVEWES